MLFRALAALVGVVITVAGAPAFAQAGDWPGKPITLVLPQAPGGGTDVLGRLWAEFVGKSLNATIVVAARARLDALQYEPLPGGPELVKEWMQRDARVWGPVLKRLAISND